MSVTLLHKKSSTPGDIPTSGQLTLGELALNTYDGKAFFKKNNGAIVTLSVEGHSHNLNDIANKDQSTDIISTTRHLESGRGSGGVALTINDGQGNANVTFNHMGGNPEQNGNAARIEVNTDATSNAYFSFELKSNVTSGVAVALTPVLRLTETTSTLTGNLVVTGDVTANSDERLKEDIRPITNALNMVLRMDGRRYAKDGKQSIGVIAQEIEAILPEVVHQGDEYKSVAYGNIVAVLIEAIKELANGR